MVQCTFSLFSRTYQYLLSYFHWQRLFHAIPKLLWRHVRVKGTNNLIHKFAFYLLHHILVHKFVAVAIAVIECPPGTVFYVWSVVVKDVVHCLGVTIFCSAYCLSVNHFSLLLRGLSVFRWQHFSCSLWCQAGH